MEIKTAIELQPELFLFTFCCKSCGQVEQLILPPCINIHCPSCGVGIADFIAIEQVRERQIRVRRYAVIIGEEEEDLIERSFATAEARAAKLPRSKAISDVAELSDITVKCECSICMDHDAEEDDVATLNICKHKFHRKCLEKWLKECKNTCPVCRCVIE